MRGIAKLRGLESWLWVMQMVLIILLYQIVLDQIWRSKKFDLRDSKYSWTWEAFRALIWFEISFHVPGQIHFHFNMFSEKHDALEKNFHKLLIHNDRSSSFLEKFPNSNFFCEKLNFYFVNLFREKHRSHGL